MTTIAHVPTSPASNPIVGGHWIPVRDGDPRARALFERHYSVRRQRPRSGVRGNAERFAGPGSHLILLTVGCDALFVWRQERYRRDGQSGVNCAVFRNESVLRSSDLIREACALAWARWPGARLFTFVNPRRVASPNPGYCFKVAGWRWCGHSKEGLHILEIQPYSKREAA